MAETLWSVRAVCSRNSGRYIMQQDATRKVPRGGKAQRIGSKEGDHPGWAVRANAARATASRSYASRDRRLAYVSKRLCAVHCGPVSEACEG